MIRLCALLLAAGVLPVRAAVLSGLDVLERDSFAPLAGKRVAVITNHTGVDASGRSAVDLLFRARGVRLVAILTPEHGFRGEGRDGEEIGDSTDTVTGLPIYSLYGRTRRPTDAMLRGVDALVFDVQDVGARFYTYLTTMAYAIEEAAARNLAFYVLDRPNPLSGSVLEGPVYDGPPIFTAYFPVPVRHGMTAGEIALLHAGTRGLRLELSVIKAFGWDRAAGFDETGLPWVRPSPNIRGLDAAILYPGIGAFESTNVSVGRGTESPFTWFGAPWMDSAAVLHALRQARLQGARFALEERTPTESLYRGRRCPGVRIEVTDRKKVRPLEIFVHAVCALRASPSFNARKPDFEAMTGANLFKAVFESKEPPLKILADFEASWRAFEQARQRYLLY